MSSLTPAFKGQNALSDAPEAAGSLKRWSTPRVIVSAAQNAEAHVTNNPPDGTSSTFGIQYGS